MSKLKKRVKELEKSNEGLKAYADDIHNDLIRKNDFLLSKLNIVIDDLLERKYPCGHRLKTENVYLYRCLLLEEIDDPDRKRSLFYIPSLQCVECKHRRTPVGEREEAKYGEFT